MHLALIHGTRYATCIVVLLNIDPTKISRPSTPTQDAETVGQASLNEQGAEAGLPDPAYGPLACNLGYTSNR